MPDRKERWRLLCPANEIPENRPVRRQIGPMEFLLLRRGMKVEVCGNTCPHHGAKLSEGAVIRGEIVCPKHHARFRADDGLVSFPPALDGIPCFDAKIEQGQLYVGRPQEMWMPGAPSETASGEAVVVVGAGAAGLACAEALRREGFGGSITMISAESRLPYDRTLISKSAISVSPAGIEPIRTKDYLELLRISVLTNTRAVGLDTAQRTVRLEDGSSLEYRHLVLATGSSPRRLDIPGEDLPGCVYLRDADDAEALVAHTAAGDPVVIIGAGLIGLESAASLRGRGLEVTVVAPEPVPMAGPYGAEIGSRIQALHEAGGTKFRLGTTPVRIHGSRTVTGVELSDGETIAAGTVVVGVGAIPRVDLFGLGTGLGGVEVDQQMATSTEGVFAAGDIASLPIPSLGITARLEHWTSAVHEGQLVARSILGQQTRYDGVPFFWSDQYESTLKCIGIPTTGAERRIRGKPSQGEFLVGYFAEGRMTAAAGFGLEQQLIELQDAMAHGAAPPPEQFAASSGSY